MVPAAHHLDETLAVTERQAPRVGSSVCGHTRRGQLIGFHSMTFLTFPFNIAYLERFELAQERQTV